VKYIEQDIESEIKFFKKHTIEPKYDEEYTDRVLELLKYSSFHKKLTILDIGCGQGYWGRKFNNKKNIIIGIDLIKDTIKHTSKEKIDKNQFFVIGNIKDFPFKESKFDLMICGGILHHFPSSKELKLLIENFNRSLRISGKLVIIEPNGSNPVIKLTRMIGCFLDKIFQIGFASKNERVHSCKLYLKILEQASFKKFVIESLIQKMKPIEKRNIFEYIFRLKKKLIHILWNFLWEPHKGSELIIISSK